jgi:hypothetical protein
MNTIQATYDILNKNWAVSLNSVSQRENELAISFVADEGIAKAKFENLMFGYDLKLNGEVVSSDHYPKQGQIYEWADTNPLATPILKFIPNKTYQLYLYAENAGHHTEQTIEIVVPKPNKPYNSWTWSDEAMEWLPPIPQPKDYPHEWNEETGSWVKRNMPI